MENYKSIKFLVPIFILGFFVVNISNVFAYDIETHASLTQSVVDFYNKNFPDNQIPKELTLYLLDGSRREDDPPRWMNHFYDPVYNRGLTDTILGTWQKSKDWAQDSNNQTKLKYSPIIATILSSWQSKIIQKYFPTSNFTWEEAIRYWVQGNKEMAMFSLGHILHLIGDASVPDHTRNDDHPGDSPYENYTQQFTFSNPDINLSKRLLSKSPVIFSDLNSYFDELSEYSNNNFYSRDTIGIQSGYKKPEPDYVDKEGKFFYAFKKNIGENTDYKLFVYKRYYGSILLASKQDIELTISEDGNKVISDYWSRLSTKSVQYGAGVINLFFQEAEKAKNDPNFAKTEEKSIFARAFGATKNLFAQVGNFFSGIVGNNQNFQEAGQITLEQPDEVQTVQADKTAPQKPLKTAIEPLKVDQQNQLQENKLAETEEDENVPQQEEIRQATTTLLQTTSTLPQTANFKQCGFQTNQSPSRQKVIINEVAWMGTAASANDEWIELKNISNTEVDLNGWQLIDQGEQIKINLGLIYKTKIPAGGFILLERTDDNSVPNITADLIYTGILSNTNEGLRFFDEQCNLIDEVLANPDWPAGDNTSATERKTMERDSTGFGWHRSSIIGGTPKATNSQPTTVYSGGGGGSASTPTSDQQQTTAKILINEIQITGGEGKSNNDFIELYNPNNFQVNLKGYRLVKRTQTGTSDVLIKSWTDDTIVTANSYYLWANNDYTDIPATPDTKTSAILSNNYGIAIRYGSNDAGTIIDSVAWGEAQNVFIEGSVFSTNPGANQSVQRKFQNNAFIDTDNNANDFEIQTCPSPKAQSRNCSATNQSPSAFFVYTPLNPQVGDLITFNAGSSTDPDGTISLFQWDFGNSQATTTQTTTTYSYTTAGDYTIQLIVFDNQNASSTATSTIISVQSAGVNHIAISEIMASAGYGHSNEEFIELYNLTDQNINLTGYFLKHINSFSSTSTENLLADFSTSTIAAKSFFLIASTEYSNASTTPDLRYNRSYHLADDEDIVILENNLGEEIDRVVYSSIDAGKSLERKAFSGGNCVSAQGDGEFLGNGCDTDNADDFEIRNTPKPQNSLSFPEPRSAPMTPQNFAVQYSSSTMELVFDWSSSQDYGGATSTITYKITDISNSSSTLSTIETASTTAKISINETGRDYQFSIQALDEDGLGSTTNTKEITVPPPTPTSQIVLQQKNSDSKSSPIESIYYLQYLGTNLSLTAKSLEIYSESNQIGNWQGGICKKALDQFFYQCPDGTLTTDIVSNEAINETGTKTLLTFTFSQPIVLTSGNSYFLYIRPYGGANFNYATSSVYGSQNNTYVNGDLTALDRGGCNGCGWMNTNLGISDMYFILRSP